MASDKNIGDTIFDWHYPQDTADARMVLADVEKYIANPRNEHVMPYLLKQKEAFELLLTIPLQK
jgi:hypothetical protein